MKLKELIADRGVVQAGAASTPGEVGVFVSKTDGVEAEGVIQAPAPACSPGVLAGQEMNVKELSADPEVPTHPGKDAVFQTETCGIEVCDEVRGQLRWASYF